MIRSLTLPSSTMGENPLRFPIPQAGQPGTVTVLCGPNGSGKTFILRMLKNIADGKVAGQYTLGHGYKLEFADDHQAASHRPTHHPAQMGSIGILSSRKAAKVPAVDDFGLRAQIFIFGLLIEAIGRPTHFKPAAWASDPAYRYSIVEALGPEDEECVYWLSREAPEFARLFEDAFACRLGLRRAAGRLELVLGWPTEITAAFSTWSDGQKSFFTVLATTLALKPDVYIFDEIENFMHPGLISRTIEHLKHNCRQTILSSHHPHLIFGRAVDAVYYVEALEPERPRFAHRLAKYQKQPSAPRRITRLETDRAKLATAYRLFDLRDAALLASAAQVRSAVDAHVNEAVLTTFGCSAAAAHETVFVDRQTQQIATFIRSFSPQPPLILDWGAGLGRTITELSKQPSSIDLDQFSWLLYEPDPSTRKALRHAGLCSDADVRVVESRFQLEGTTAGLVLLTNVLHALDPAQWCDALLDAWSATKGAERGVILATEIYPLLAPERHAVPLPADWLSNLFRTLGFKVAERHFSILGSSSYCIAATAPPDPMWRRDQLHHLVLTEWHSLSQRYLGVYDGLGEVRSLADEKDLLNAVFGLARVSSCLRNENRETSE